MSNAASSQGTYISHANAASPSIFTEIAEVVSIGGPKETTAEIDVTHLRSSGGYREFIQSFKDGGQLPLTLNFIPGDATQDATTGLRSWFQSGAIDVWKITYPDGSTCSFSAWVMSIGEMASVGAKLALDVTIRISGATTWVEV